MINVDFDIIQQLQTIHSAIINTMRWYISCF